jgi:type VI protein secretion system component VasF
MLAYLDSLCAALLARNTEEIRRLLAHPMAQDLPRRVREEAVAISRAGRRSFIAPVNALHLYYKLTHMVDETSDPTFTAPEDKGGVPPADAGQIELPLRKVGNR